MLIINELHITFSLANVTLLIVSALHNHYLYTASHNPLHMAHIPKRTTGYSWIKSTPKPKKEFSRVHDERYNSKRWRNHRAAFLAANPVCAVDGCGAIATVCDHITPVTAGGDFWSGPFQPLCKSCHNRKSSRERHALR